MNPSIGLPIDKKEVGVPTSIHSILLVLRITSKNMDNKELLWIKATKKKSINKWLHWVWAVKNYSNISSRMIAYVGDRIAKQKMIAVMSEMAELFGCEPKRRKEITDWMSRKLPKIRIGKHLYYLEKKKEL